MPVYSSPPNMMSSSFSGWQTKVKLDRGVGGGQTDSLMASILPSLASSNWMISAIFACEVYYSFSKHNVMVIAFFCSYFSQFFQHFLLPRRLLFVRFHGRFLGPFALLLVFVLFAHVKCFISAQKFKSTNFFAARVAFINKRRGRAVF